MFNKISKFLLEVRQELKRVNWPARKELMEATLIVVVSTGILTIIIWIIDIFYARGMKFLF